MKAQLGARRGGWSTPRLSRSALPPRRDPVLVVRKVGWDLGPV